MNYHNQIINQRKSGLESMSDDDLYDTANGYADFDHGQGFYSRNYLIQLILNFEYKMPIQTNI